MSNLFVRYVVLQLHWFVMQFAVKSILIVVHCAMLMSCPALCNDTGLQVGQAVEVPRSSAASPISIHSYVTKTSCSLCEKALDENVRALRSVYPGLEYRKYIAGASEEELDYYRRACPFAIVISDELSFYRRAVSAFTGSFWVVVDKNKRVVYSEVTSNIRSFDEILSVLPRPAAVEDHTQGHIATIPLGEYSPLVDARRVYETADGLNIAVVVDRANCVILHDIASKLTRTVKIDSALGRSMIGILHSSQVGTTDTLMILANDFQSYRLCVRFNMRTGTTDTLPLTDLLTDSIVNWATSAVYSPLAQVVVTSPIRMRDHRPMKPDEPLNIGIPLHRPGAVKQGVVHYGAYLPEEYKAFSWTGLTNPAYRLTDVATDVVCTWPAYCEQVYCWSPSTGVNGGTVFNLVNLPSYYRAYKKDYPYQSDRTVRNKEYSLRSFPVDVFVRDSSIGVIFSNYTFTDTLVDGMQYRVQVGYHVQRSDGNGTTHVVTQELLDEGVSATFSCDAASVLISNKVGRSLNVFRRRF